MFSCVDFPNEWWGIRFTGKWTPETSGGVPTTGSKAQVERWGQNPQYTLILKQKCEIFISLMQEDGRCIKDSIFPYDGIINTACFSVMKLANNERRLNVFDDSRISKLSVMKLHREVQIRETFLPGRYVIVPSTMVANKTGNF